MPRRLKTAEEMKEGLQRFDSAVGREQTKVLRNALERILAASQGRRLPAKYKMKLPHLTRTVVE